MTEAPKRIWIDPTGEDEDGFFLASQRFDYVNMDKEYVSADLVRWHRIDDENNPPPKDGMDTILVFSPEGVQLAWWSDGNQCWLTPEGGDLWGDPTHYRLIDTPEDEG